MDNIVYKIINRSNKKYYIGSTYLEDRRMKCHTELYKAAIRQNNNLHLDMFIQGRDEFDIEVLYRTNDTIEASRMESRLIRENKDDKNMYNITLGASGRRVFYQSDIEFIREMYQSKSIYIEEAYNKYYKDIVTFRAFKKVWHGETFKDIKYWVYTPENKAWHFAKGQSRPGDKNGNSKLKLQDVLNIRKRRDLGEDRTCVYMDYQHLGITKSGFNRVWTNKTWTNV